MLKMRMAAGVQGLNVIGHALLLKYWSFIELSASADAA